MLTLQDRFTRQMHEAMASMQLVDVEIEHQVTDRLYRRAGLMKKGCLYLGMKHRRENQWAVLSGAILEFDADTKACTMVRGISHGVTAPGTQRVILCLEDCVFAAYYPLPEEIVDAFRESGDYSEIERYLYEPVEGNLPRLNFVTGCLDS